jgi:hypothetical protein
VYASGHKLIKAPGENKIASHGYNELVGSLKSLVMEKNALQHTQKIDVVAQHHVICNF